MAIKSITEFTIQPGRRDEFARLFESLVAQSLSTLRDAGCSEATLWAVVDDPDKAVEIADWESGQARDAAMQSGAFGVFAPMFELLAGPVSATWSSDRISPKLRQLRISERAMLRRDRRSNDEC